MCLVVSATKAGYLGSTPGQCASFCKTSNSSCKRFKSACKAFCCSRASCQDLVDKTSIRWVSSSAVSRCTWARCSSSSTCLTRSVRAWRKPASGSRDKGAPALAASRCHAMASATLNGWACNRVWALSAHSWAKLSWVLVRLSSSSFSRKSFAAPLSRALISLNTCCKSSGEGSLASHSRKREDRSPEVGAVKAPEVNASKVGKSGVLSEDVVTVTQIGWLSP